MEGIVKRSNHQEYLAYAENMLAQNGLPSYFVIFPLWGYLSAHQDVTLSSELHLGAYLDSRKYTFASLKERLLKVTHFLNERDVYHEVPALDWLLTTDEVRGQVNDTFIRDLSIILRNSIDYFGLSDVQTWVTFYRQVLLDYLSKPNAGFGDPLNFTALIAETWRRLEKRDDRNHQVLNPFSNGGNLAVRLFSESDTSNVHLYGREQSKLLYHISLCNQLVFGDQLGHFVQESFEDVSIVQGSGFTNVLGIFPVKDNLHFTLLEYLLLLISQGSISIIITTSALLFRSVGKSNDQIEILRRKILDTQKLKALVSLPVNHKFAGRTSMVMLVFDGSKNHNETIVIDAENINTVVSKNKSLRKEDIDKIIDAIANHKIEAGFCQIYKRSQLYDEHLGLNIPSLVPSKETVTAKKGSLSTLKEKEQLLKTELIQVRSQLEETFSKLFS